ncbi:MAG: hypothetical protein ACKVVP_10195 [Chloroflexota bacterium]
MEIAFLICFAFGSLFTLFSAALSGIGSHGGHDVHHPHGFHVDHGDASHNHPQPVGHSREGRLEGLLEYVNLYSINGFLTWFGAVGFGLTHFAGWPLAIASGLATGAGALGGFTVAVFLSRLKAGERVMQPADYRMEGTLAHVSVSIPRGGVGEIVFEKHGARRSEAARSADSAGIAHGVEVMILTYSGGIAEVRPFRDVLAERFPDVLTDESSTPPKS